jgi:hypothetical protein
LSSSDAGKKIQAESKNSVVSIRKKREIHPESLLNIPLVKMAIANPATKIIHRRVDSGWKQNGVIPISAAGFNFHKSLLCVPAKSPLSEWLQDPYGSARWFNANDHLVSSALFLVHDYLHNWAYRAIQSLRPDLGFGVTPISKKNYDVFTFCHLLTEAVAITGLDYWYLSTIQLDDILGIGTQLRQLGVNYRENLREEYLRSNLNTEIQSPSFFEKLVEFYCTGGSFLGIWTNNIERSPVASSWVKHEIDYGTLQRKYSRQWMMHLSDYRIHDNGDLSRKVPYEEKWQVDLARQVGDMLWAKVKNNEFVVPDGGIDPADAWESKRKSGWDFRFMNIDAADEKMLFNMDLWENSSEIFRYFFYQFVSTFHFHLLDKELFKLFPFLIEKRDFKLVKHLFKGQRQLAECQGEPRDIFILA